MTRRNTLNDCVLRGGIQDKKFIGIIDPRDRTASKEIYTVRYSWKLKSKEGKIRLKVKRADETEINIFLADHLNDVGVVICACGYEADVIKDGREYECKHCEDYTPATD